MNAFLTELQRPRHDIRPRNDPGFKALALSKTSP